MTVFVLIYQMVGVVCHENEDRTGFFLEGCWKSRNAKNFICELRCKIRCYACVFPSSMASAVSLLSRSPSILAHVQISTNKEKN